MANCITLNQTSYHGAGAIQSIPDEVKAHGLNKAFVCSDPDLIKFGVTKKVTDVLDAAKLEYEIYSIWSRLFYRNRRWFFYGYSKSHWCYH